MSDDENENGEGNGGRKQSVKKGVKKGRGKKVKEETPVSDEEDGLVGSGDEYEDA